MNEPDLKVTGHVDFELNGEPVDFLGLLRLLVATGTLPGAVKGLLEQATQPEVEGPSWDDFKKAWGVFAGDYKIVDHPNTPVRRPWEEPNKPGDYSLTQLPEDMDADEFIKQMQDVTDIACTCMDRDCAHSTWDMLQGEGRKVAMFTWAGGVVQHDLVDRSGAVEALDTIFGYMAQLKREGKLPNLQRIHTDDHDSICGAVKAFCGGTPVHKILSEQTGRDITEHSPEEDAVMEMFIRHGARNIADLFAGTGVQIVAHLHDTNRIHPERSELKTIDLSSSQPEMDVAAFLALNRILAETIPDVIA